MGSRAKRKATPKPRRNTPKAPVWSALLGDKEAAREAAAWWRATVPELERSGLLTAVDDIVLVECAVCWARIRQCERQLAGNLLVPGPRGTQVRNPLSMTLASYRQSLQSYTKALGLSPSARQGLDIKSPPRTLDVVSASAIVRQCSNRGLNVPLDTILGRDPDELDLAGVPDDIARKYGG